MDRCALMCLFLLILINVAMCRVCFDDLGCFNRVLFTCHYRHPESPAKLGTTFTLYTRSTRGTGEVIDRAVSSTITTSDFSSTRDTKILIHGWRASTSNYRWTNMKDALLDREDVNVILVDWANGASRHYSTSRASARVIGRQIAKTIEALNRWSGARYADVHLIGHSLGAHAAGYAGEYVQQIAQQMVGRISGLDPAGPGFGGNRVRNLCRLDKTDATFVDVIHTDGELIALGGLGLMDELGHQDFYPNGGTDMPNCVFNILCDHMKAIAYYTESISNRACRFRPTEWAATLEHYHDGDTMSCDSLSCPDMGYTASRDGGVDGVFYLKTNARSPFCRG